MNEVESGKLNQKNNKIQVTGKGKIVNRVTKKIKTVTLISVVILVVGFLADFTSLYLFGEHIWIKLF